MRAQALAAIPAERAEWLLMIDQEALVDDMSFNLPLRRYEGKELVLLGDAKLLAADQYPGRASLKLKEPLQGARGPSLTAKVLGCSRSSHLP